MRPGPLLIRLTILLAASALLVAVLPELMWALVGLGAVLLIAATIEALLLRRVVFRAERQGKLAVPLDERETIVVRLTTTSRRPLRLLIRQRWPDLVEPRASVVHAIIRPGEMLPVEMLPRGIARGTATVEPLYIAVTMRGLVERIVRAGEPSIVHVLPNLHAVGRMHKRLNDYALRSLGARQAPRIGKGREFDRLRDYVRDDDYRDIAWKASARHGRLIVREFRMERSQDILLCLDRGHRMAARVEQITRLDQAVNASVLIGYVCNRMEDKTGILSFDTTVDKGLPTGRGAAHLRAITAYVTQLEAAYLHTDYLALAASLRRRLHHRTLILILTVLPEREERFDLLRAVDMLAPQHLPLFVTLTDRDLKAQAELLPSNDEELSRTLVARDLWLGRAELTRELRARGALVVESTAVDWGVDAVNAYIDVKRRQML
ncbi:MAG TPA: DUF58 domain-containing protein [Thermoanaerobaculia bacterium]|jgi:uncharacterized protein (DUF58 family)|nr:DUF58 domain-containing protein [Thermoanaerobaculia bacterium]